MCRQLWTQKHSRAGPCSGLCSRAYEHVQPVHSQPRGPSHTGMFYSDLVHTSKLHSFNLWTQGLVSKSQRNSGKYDFFRYLQRRHYCVRLLERWERAWLGWMYKRNTNRKLAGFHLKVLQNSSQQTCRRMCGFFFLCPAVFIPDWLKGCLSMDNITVTLNAVKTRLYLHILHTRKVSAGPLFLPL